MKGLHCHVTKTLIVVSFLILASCGIGRKSLEKEINRATVDYQNVLAVVLDYYNEHHGYSNVQDARPCYKLYPKVSTYKESFYYSIWNTQIEYQRKLPSVDPFYDFTSIQREFDGVSLDSTDLRMKVAFSYSLTKLDSIGDYCVIFYQEEDSYDQVMWFSPLIKVTKEDHYHIALHILKDRDDWGYLFLLKEVEGDLQVIDYVRDDNWPTRGIPEGYPNFLEDY